MTDQFQAERARARARASQLFEPPDSCPSCGAVLKDVPVQGIYCPHCAYDLESQPPGDGQAQREERRARGLTY